MLPSLPFFSVPPPPPPPPPAPAQVSVLFDGDGQWYRGEVVGYDPRRGRALILYDDGEDEWVELGQEELTWHCQLAGHSGIYPGVPRGAWKTPGRGKKWREQGERVAGWWIACSHGLELVFSPGCLPDCVSGLACLGLSCPEEPLPCCRLGNNLPNNLPSACGLLAAPSDHSFRHIPAAFHLPQQPAPHLPLAAPTGQAPAGAAAIGWRVGVYWTMDQAFYCGEIVGFDPASGRHEVAYDDGEEGPLNLGVDKVKWILPPGAAGGRRGRAVGRAWQGRGRAQRAMAGMAWGQVWRGWQGGGLVCCLLCFLGQAYRQGMQVVCWYYTAGRTAVNVSPQPSTAPVLSRTAPCTSNIPVILPTPQQSHKPSTPLGHPCCFPACVSAAAADREKMEAVEGGGRGRRRGGDDSDPDYEVVSLASHQRVFQLEGCKEGLCGG